MDTIVTITGTLLVTAGLIAGPAVIQASEDGAHAQDVIATCVTLGPDYRAATDVLGLSPTVWNVAHGLTTVTAADIAATCPETGR